ncbi:hypothetical protein AX17_005908 [Amanita inopinata Kibby_2008]|nr:hypothetical protein AX17_005908 [Amanita inopinata Kibby_2008]
MSESLQQQQRQQQQQREAVPETKPAPRPTTTTTTAAALSPPSSTTGPSVTGPLFPSAARARSITLLKGIFTLSLSLSLLLAPSLLYDGTLPILLSKSTPLPSLNATADPPATFAIATLLMGFAWAEIRAGRSEEAEAYQTVGECPRRAKTTFY